MPYAPHGMLTLAGSPPGATLTIHAPGSALKEHRHEHPFMTVVLRGEYVEETGHTIDRVRAGDAVIHPIGERHRNRFSPSGAVCLNLTEQHLAAMPQRLADVPTMSSRRLLRNLAIHALAPALGAALLGSDARVPLDAGLRRILRGASSDDVTVPQWLHQFDALLRRRFRERTGLAALAREVGQSPGHLARSYRKAYGLTVGQRIRELRIEWALERIRTTQQPLSQIACIAGFADQAHLSRWIRQAVGCTPSAIRRG